jgi:hypothetical protein
MKRLIFSLLIGLSFPIVHFVTLLFLRAFRAPDSVTDPLIWLLVWPFWSNVALLYCRVIPRPTSVVTMFVLGSLTNGLLVFLLTYGLIYIVQKKRLNKPMVEPPPPTF